MKTVALTVLALCMGIPLTLGKDSAKIMRGTYFPHDSAPPGDKPFGCIYELTGKPYSPEAVQKCLDAISTRPFVERVWVRRYNVDGNDLLIEFNVKTALLKNESIEFKLDPLEAAQLKSWLDRNPATLRVGGYYSQDAYSTTWEGIREFYAARGILVSPTPTVNLDYKARRARLSFQIDYGPKIPVSGAIPPYSISKCDDPVIYVDESQVDEHVPRPYIESQIALTSAYSCYDPGVARRDVETLNSLSILDNVKVTYKGTYGDRQIFYKIKGKPLTVRHVELKSFGSPSPCVENSDAELDLKSGDVYLRSVANDVVTYLEKTACTRPTSVVTVTEQDQPVGATQVDVTFNILTTSPHTIVIDGAVQ